MCVGMCRGVLNVCVCVGVCCVCMSVCADDECGPVPIDVQAHNA